jgi:hypothetical protein
MDPYAFMEAGEIRLSDVQRLIELTQQGVLVWRGSSGRYAMSAEPVTGEALDWAAVSAELVGANLRGVRIGWNPSTDKLHFLRLTDHGHEQHYVEAGSSPELMAAGEELHQLGRRALRLGGRLTRGEEGDVRPCSTCEQDTEHMHLHDAPYGLAGATMAGSERYVCTVCETPMFCQPA